MPIKIIENPEIENFSSSLELLNRVFSVYPNFKTYTPERCFNKLNSSSKNAIFEYGNDNNEVVGFAYGYERYPEYYHIWELGVDDQYRGQGIATALYDKVETFAKEKKFNGVTLNTFNRFKENIRLAIKRGYKIYDLNKTDEYSQDPKIMMRLEFYK